ncbi:hypothetical protein [Hoeflea sp.]|uniref:hypothetical protein n=1 Tax=Hoeflea sp. TaxID=1940281 RepID=UPI003B51C431
MTKASITVILVALATALSSPAAAQTYEFDIRGNASTTGDPEVESERGAAVNFDFEAGIKLGLLLGEPLVSLRMRYELTGGIVTTPTFEPGEDRYETRQLDLLPSEAKDRLRLYNAKIRFTFDSGTGDAVELIADAGHLRPAGELSFNVPGSPDWDELFIVPGSIFQNGEPTYYNEASAQAIWASGLTLRAWDFEDISLTLRDMHRWYAENNERPRFLALQRAIRQVEQGVKASYGYQFRGDSTDPLLDGMSNVATWLEVEAETGGFDGEVEYDKQQWQEVLSRAEVRFLRLSSLPSELAIGGNHQPYQEAVRNARRLLFATDEMIRGFEPEGVDVASLEEGYEPEFEGATAGAGIIFPRKVSDNPKTFEWVSEDGSTNARVSGFDSAGPMVGGFACVADRYKRRFNIVTAQGNYIDEGREGSGGKDRGQKGFEQVTVSPEGYITVVRDFDEGYILSSDTLEYLGRVATRIAYPVHQGWVRRQSSDFDTLFHVKDRVSMKGVQAVIQDFVFGYALVIKNDRLAVVAPDQSSKWSFSGRRLEHVAVLPGKIIECPRDYTCDVRDIDTGDVIGQTNMSSNPVSEFDAEIFEKSGRLYMGLRQDAVEEGGSRSKFSVFDMDLNPVETGAVAADDYGPIANAMWARGYHPHAFTCGRFDRWWTGQRRVPETNAETGEPYYIR